jgi:hypothetical protein
LVERNRSGQRWGEQEPDLGQAARLPGLVGPSVGLAAAMALVEPTTIAGEEAL